VAGAIRVGLPLALSAPSVWLYFLIVFVEKLLWIPLRQTDLIDAGSECRIASIPSPALGCRHPIQIGERSWDVVAFGRRQFAAQSRECDRGSGDISDHGRPIPATHEHLAEPIGLGIGEMSGSGGYVGRRNFSATHVCEEIRPIESH